MNRFAIAAMFAFELAQTGHAEPVYVMKNGVVSVEGTEPIAVPSLIPAELEPQQNCPGGVCPTPQSARMPVVAHAADAVRFSAPVTRFREFSQSRPRLFTGKLLYTLASRFRVCR